MSMDLYVLVDHNSTLTVVEWQQAIDANHECILYGCCINNVI